MKVENILFLLVLAAGVVLFVRSARKLRRNILLGREQVINDRKGERWAVMARVALGQSKMVVRPVAGIMHILIYAGFVVINIEVLEIIIDGMIGTHRVFRFLGGFYDFLIGSFEWLAVAVLLACVVFLARRNVLRLKRFWMREMTPWPRTDANIILVTEILLMAAFLNWNATDQLLAQRSVGHFVQAGAFPISSLLWSIYEPFRSSTLQIFERTYWWFHIVGILAFLNYLIVSKHLHIILAFPNVWYSNLEAKGRMRNMPRVTQEVKLMLDPSAPAPQDPNTLPEKFGAKDVFDLSWKQLMDAYSCTECGRCTSECPANITGKLLSPRKIMMDTRDRIEEVGRVIDRKGKWEDDGRALLGNYILEEELWACTTCNACVQACPVNIDPLGIILDLRRYLVMEESKARPALSAMFTNIENNGAPWQFAQADRLNWAQEPS